MHKKSQKITKNSNNLPLSVTLTKLLTFCKPHKFGIIIAILFAIIGAVCTIIGPSFIQQIAELIGTDEVLLFGEPVDLNAVTKIAVFLVCLYIFGAILNYFQGYIMATITQNITRSMRTDISKKINRLPLRYLDKNSTGDLLSRVTNDVDTIGQTLNSNITGLIGAITLFLGTLIMMFVTNWILAIASILSTLIGFGIMSAIMKKSQKHFRIQQSTLGKLNGHIEEMYTGHTILKAYNGEENSLKKFEKINNALYNSAWKSQFLSGLMGPLMKFIGNLGFVVVCVLGSFLAVNGTITFGVIIAFLIYVRLFTQPLSQIAQAMTSLQSTTAAADRVVEFLSESEMPDEQHKNLVLDNVKGNVEFKNVCFGYNVNKQIIHNFSAKISAGQKVAIVGPTGAGKTTIVNLLMRFYDVDSGEILIDGVPTHSLTRENVHSLFGMVLQDTWLFQGTIFENIRYNKHNVTDEEIISACVSVGIDHFIRTLPNGYNTILDDSTSISAGQRQLLTIARAMVQDNPMLILDEATSSVDTRTEILIQNAMDKLTQNRTSFVIAHRLSTIKNADLILVLRDGDIIEQGTHHDLLALNGFYATLYNSQFNDEE